MNPEQATLISLSLTLQQGETFAHFFLSLPLQLCPSMGQLDSSAEGQVFGSVWMSWVQTWMQREGLLAGQICNIHSGGTSKGDL